MVTKIKITTKSINRDMYSRVTETEKIEFGCITKELKIEDVPKSHYKTIRDKYLNGV